MSEPELAILYDKVDSIGGRAFMAGGEVRDRVGKKVEQVKSLYTTDPVQFKKEAEELINWAESDNNPIPDSW
jgi:hypothetical protein